MRNVDETLEALLDSLSDEITSTGLTFTRTPADKSPSSSPSARKGGGQARIEELLDLLPQTCVSAKRVHLLQEAARIYQQELDMPAEALLTLRAALLENPSYQPVADAIAELASDTQSWAPLLSELMGEASDRETKDPASAAWLWYLIATWYFDHLALAASAQAALDKSLDLSPNFEEGELLRLRLHKQAEDWPAAIELSIAIAERSRCSHQKISVLFADAAKLSLEKLGDGDRAIDLYQKAHESDPRALGPLEELERLYRRKGAMVSVCRVVWKRAKLLEDDTLRRSAELQVAHILEAELDKSDQAAKIYQRIGEPCQALALLREGSHRSSGEVRAEFHFRIARLLHFRPEALEASEDGPRREQLWHLEEALSHRPNFPKARQLLLEHYEAMEEWGKATRLYEARATFEDGSARTDTLLRAAFLRGDKLGQVDAAIAHAEEILLDDRDNILARFFLLKLYCRAKRVDDAATLVERLLLRADDLDETDRAELFIHAAESDLRHDREGSAIEFYQAALRVTPNRIDVLLALSEVYLARKDWIQFLNCAEPVAERCAAIPDNEAAILPNRKRAELHAALGQAHAELGYTEAGLQHYETSLALAPGDKEVQQAALRLRAACGDWDAVVIEKEWELSVSKGETRITVLRELAELEEDKRKQPRKALEHYMSLISECSVDLGLYDKAVDLATSLSEWPRVLELCTKKAEKASDRFVRAQALHVAAGTARDRLGEIALAKDFFDQALQNYFYGIDEQGKSEGVDGFDACTMEQLAEAMQCYQEEQALYEQLEDWREQERSARRMIKRLSAQNPYLGGLWFSLGALYLNRLDNSEAAIAALEVARDLCPDSIRCREELAEIYARALQTDKAIHEHHEGLRLEPHRRESLRALSSLYASQGRERPAWTMAQLLYMQGAGKGEENHRYVSEKGSMVRPPQKPLSAEMLPLLLHCDQDPHLSSVLHLLTPLLTKAGLSSPAGRTLRPKEKLGGDILKDPRLYPLRYYAFLLGLQPPALYERESGPHLLSSELTGSGESLERALLIGKGYRALPRESDRAFWAGRMLAKLRQENLVSLCLTDGRQLDVVLRWALEAASTHPLSIKTPGGSSISSLRVQDPLLLNQLKQLASRVEEREIEISGKRWLRGQTRSLDRMGLLLCGDLETAVRCLKSQEVADSEDRIEDLTRFTQTEQFVELIETAHPSSDVTTRSSSSTTSVMPPSLEPSLNA